MEEEEEAPPRKALCTWGTIGGTSRQATLQEVISQKMLTWPSRKSIWRVQEAGTPLLSVLLSSHQFPEGAGILSGRHSQSSLLLPGPSQNAQVGLSQGQPLPARLPHSGPHGIKPSPPACPLLSG